VLSLVVQGLTLPWVVRKVKFEDPDHRRPAEEQDRLVGEKIAAFSLKFLREQEDTGNNGYIQQLIHRYANEQETAQTRREDLQRYREVYVSLLENQRRYLVELNRESSVDEEIIRKWQGLVDLEEEKVFSKFEIE